MGKFCLVVISTPVQGKDAEFNDWYDNQHIPDVLRVPGFVSAQRLKVLPETSDLPGRYMTTYQMETDDPEACMKDLFSRAGTLELVMSDAVDPASTSMTLCSVLTEQKK